MYFTVSKLHPTDLFKKNGRNAKLKTIFRKALATSYKIILNNFEKKNTNTTHPFY